MKTSHLVNIGSYVHDSHTVCIMMTNEVFKKLAVTDTKRLAPLYKIMQFLKTNL